MYDMTIDSTHGQNQPEIHEDRTCLHLLGSGRSGSLSSESDEWRSGHGSDANRADRENIKPFKMYSCIVSEMKIDNTHGQKQPQIHRDRTCLHLLGSARSGSLSSESDGSWFVILEPLTSASGKMLVL